jgi:hypothetical protein
MSVQMKIIRYAMSDTDSVAAALGESNHRNISALLDICNRYRIKLIAN